MSSELSEFQTVLETEGLHALLRLLNARTPHRFTGVYRFDGSVLRNVALFDLFQPDLPRGDDVAMENAYCALVGRSGEPLEFDDAQNDPRFPYRPGSPVVCYCGVPILDEQGHPRGTLCHFDILPCEPRRSDVALLAAIAPLIFGSSSFQVG